MLKFLGVLTIEAFAASAMGMFIGCLAKDGDAAMAIGPPVMTVFILFSGRANKLPFKAQIALQTCRLMLPPRFD